MIFNLLARAFKQKQPAMECVGPTMSMSGNLLPSYNPERCDACGNTLAIHRGADLACPCIVDGQRVDFSTFAHFESPSLRAYIFDRVALERNRQDELRGEQHWPLRPEGADWDKSFEDGEKLAKAVCDGHAADRTLTWWHIANEELMEAMAAKTRDNQIKELIEHVAVCVAALENLIEDEARS